MSDYPTFARLADLATVITLMGVEQRAMSFAGDGTFVLVEGDAAPRGFRGQKRSYEFPTTAVWPLWAGPAARTFLTMLETAYASPDARLLVNHASKFGAELLASSLVEVHEWDLEIRKPAGIIAVAFTMTQVA